MEKEGLMDIYKRGKESRRAHAILLFKEGHKTSEIAKLFFVDEDTVRNWIKKWDEEKTTDDKFRSGKPKKINPEIEQRICEIVDENEPQKHGFIATSWDCNEIRIWLKKMYDIEASNEQIRKILKKNGFNYRKLNYKFLKADDNQKHKFMEDFKQLIDDKRGTLIFQDEMSSKLHPNKGRIWTRETKPFIGTNCSHKKTYVIGGVAPDKGKTYTITDGKFNGGVFINFLKLLLSSIKGNIDLIIDNSPVHHCKEVKDFLEKKPRIKIICLPKYSPEMNPKENFWNYIRKKFLNNKLFETVEEMAEEVEKFIKSIPKKVVKKICSYNYLLRKT
jgi:putative transposase